MESGFTIFYADSKDDEGEDIEPKIVFTDEFYDNDNNAAAFDKILEWRDAKRLGGVRALEAASLPTPTPASGATPATQTGKIFSKALSNEDLEKIGNKLAQDFVEEDWSDTEKTKTSAKSTPKVGAVGSTNKAGITTANSPFATNTPQQSTLIKAAKSTHTSSGSEAVPIDFDKGGDSSVRKRVVKGKPDVDEGDEDDSDQEEKRRTPTTATPTAPEKEKKPRKKRTSKGKTKD
ncbi:hypothetical protein K457DRAFT_897141 [Linnemannia elongata AG-77]|uniref:Uncharacterized protein n=1 Tax=Linnemannia elongata AG-77 TaxID=1314771 RepID=A0A197JR94_9FUNG|nr:hypothetical protein K457DRAFT_897141 [Linnemannia elongata AG-77]